MNIEDPIWMNGLRFFTMLLGAILLGLLWRWATFERRRLYVMLGAGVSVLAAEQIIVHYTRLGEPLNWQIPVNIVAFGLLIFSMAGLQREAVRRHRTSTERRSHS